VAGGPVGVSAPRPSEARSAADAAVDGLPLPDDFRAHLTRASERFLSRGHAGRFDAIVWANDVALDGGAPDAADEYENGALFVEEVIGRVDAKASPFEAPPSSFPPGAAGLLVMEKRAGAWRFAVVDAQGAVAREGRVDACPLCHREAPRDFVFRTPPASSALPRGQSSSAAATATLTASAPTTVATAAATSDARSAGSAALPSSR
jgi:hypothetical protein